MIGRPSFTGRKIAASWAGARFYGALRRIIPRFPPRTDDVRARERAQRTLPLHRAWWSRGRRPLRAGGSAPLHMGATGRTSACRPLPDGQFARLRRPRLPPPPRAPSPLPSWAEAAAAVSVSLGDGGLERAAASRRMRYTARAAASNAKATLSAFAAFAGPRGWGRRWLCGGGAGGGVRRRRRDASAGRRRGGRRVRARAAGRGGALPSPYSCRLGRLGRLDR